MEVTGIKGNQYTFTPEFEDSTACDNYMFQVKAVNSAGTETPSETITRTLPSVPAAPLVPYVIKNPPALEVIVKVCINLTQLTMRVKTRIIHWEKECIS